jgi:hypothetical protein|uniref:Uncharacterized protein n=1 Tax=viral metagenome TaxID=1070528 RepID=A0A6C0J243_9ZZZZ
MELSKDMILKYVHLIEEFKQKDKKIIDLTSRMNTIQQNNRDLYSMFQTDPNNRDIQNALNAATNEYNNLKKEKEDYLKSTFKLFIEKCPKSIATMVMDDAVNFELLEHVLTQFNDLNSGKISYNEGLNNGLEFIKKVNNLPDDFFLKQ